jgi:hypothetical protein
VVNTTCELTIIDSFGCLAVTNCKVLINTAGVEDMRSVGKMVLIFPDPGSGSLNILVDRYSYRKTRVDIFNSEGRLVVEIPVDSPLLNFDVSDLAPGIYLYRWKENQSVRESGSFLIR